MSTRGAEGVLLTGVYGSGKSSVAEDLAYLSAERPTTIVIKPDPIRGTEILNIHIFAIGRYWEMTARDRWERQNYFVIINTACSNPCIGCYENFFALFRASGFKNQDSYSELPCQCLRLCRPVYRQRRIFFGQVLYAIAVFLVALLDALSRRRSA